MSKTNTFLNIFIVVLLIVILLQMCNRKPVGGTSVLVSRDTIWINKDSVIYSTPKVITHVRESDSIIIKEYYPDQNYEKLLIQYNTLLEEFLARSIYEDSLKIDSIGYVHVKDSVTRNSITGRSYHYNLNYPIIHDSVTVFAPPQREVYYGGGFRVNGDRTMDMISAGFMYKDRAERVYILSGTVNKLNTIGIQLQTFWKLK